MEKVPSKLSRFCFFPEILLSLENEQRILENEKREALRKKREQELSKLNYYRSTKSGVPKKFWNESLDTFIPQSEADMKNLQMIKLFCKKQNENNLETLLLCGNCGTGKSHLGASVIRECGGFMIDSDNMVIQLIDNQNFHSEESVSRLLSKLTTVKVLVIDEIGRSIYPEKEKVNLSYIIRQRYSNMLSTVLISNLKKKEFLQFLGSSVFDRLRETCISLSFTGESYRIKKRIEKNNLVGEEYEI